MTREDALIIKGFREKGTHRKVSNQAADKWPERGYEREDQLEGKFLCIEACVVLDEDPYEDPWR